MNIEELGFGKGTYHNINTSIDLKLPKHEAITVNKVHGNEKTIQKVLIKYPNVKVESMEGAAVFYACEQEGMPCAQIRAISNYVERRNKASWQIDLAFKNLNNWLQKFLLENY